MSSTPELCPNCGATLPPDSRFCDSCGQAIQKQEAPQQPSLQPEAYQPPQPYYQPPQQPYQQPQPAYQQPYVPPAAPKKDNKTLYIILAVVAVLLVLGCGCCGVVYLVSQNSGYDYSYGYAPLPQALGLARALFL